MQPIPCHSLDSLPAPRKVRQVSVSALATYRQCPSRAFFGYVLKLRAPQIAQAADGDRLHAELDAYAKTRDPATLGIYSTPAIAQWPTLRKITLTELPIALWLPVARVPIVAKLDFVTFNSFDVAVADYKTKDKFVYLAEAEALAHDTQAVLNSACAVVAQQRGLGPLSHSDGRTNYVTYDVANIESPDDVEFRHIYVKRSGNPDAKSVVTQITKESIANVARTGAEVNAIVELTNTALQDVPARLSQCGKYGGCEYRNICALRNLSTNPLDRFEVKSMGLSFADLLQRKPTATAAPFNPTNNPPDALPDGANPPDTASESEPDGITIPDGFACAGQSPDDLTAAQVKAVHSELHAKVACNKEAYGQYKQYTQCAIGESKAAKLREDVELLIEIVNVLAAQPAPTHAAQPAPTHAAQPAPTHAAQPAPDNRTFVATLCLGCVPIGVTSTPFETVFAPYADATCKQMQIPHLAFSDYAEGVRVAFGLFAKNPPQLSGFYTLDSFSPLRQYLVPWAHAQGMVIVTR